MTNVWGDMINGVGTAFGHVVDAASDLVEGVGEALGVVTPEYPEPVLQLSENGPAMLDMDYSNLPSGKSEQVKVYSSQIADTLMSLKTEILEARSQGRNGDLLKLLDSKEKVCKFAADFKDAVEKDSLSALEIATYVLAPAAGFVLDAIIENDADMGKVGDVMSDFVNFSEKELQVLGNQFDISNPSKFKEEAGIVVAGKDVAVAKGSSISAESATTSAESAGGAESAGASAGAGGDAGSLAERLASGKVSGAEIKQLMKHNPELLMKAFDQKEGLQSMVNFKLQEYMQAQNRMDTAMSQILKAEHDTAKAVINNWRV